MYFGGDESLHINTIETLDGCRQRCLQTIGCKYFSFRENRIGRKRCDLRFNLGFEVFRSRHAISGSVDGQCRNTELISMSNCQCDEVEKRKFGNRRPNRYSFTFRIRLR